MHQEDIRIAGDALVRHAEAWSVGSERLCYSVIFRRKRVLRRGDICEANKAEEDMKKVQSLIALSFCLAMNVLPWC